MGDPGPTRVNSSFSSALSMHSLRASVVLFHHRHRGLSTAPYNALCRRRRGENDMATPRLVTILSTVMLLAGCASPTGGPANQSDKAPSSSGSSNRAIVLAFRYELTSLSPKTAQAANGQM